ncbi:hypothetical protein CTEN210_04109 [Chaetoceros tenuissimus]|uniref:Uncharacterized protein n=1 Tax=Chaetoceros tenuissimus TaxID=426638 RepID=A0AAD3CL19_9STRA|nr:hypothetical protein CTEN210_04109 [Chaetoceros tenuissimus]
MSTSKRLKVSHTSDRGVEVPSASISDLPNDLLKHCFNFIPDSYITIAPVSRQFHRNYCTRGMDDSLTALSTDVILQVGRNKRTTADAASNDVKLTEYCFINNAPKEFMIQVCVKAAMKGRIDVIECVNIFGVDLMKVVQKMKKFRDPTTLIYKLTKEGNLKMLQYFDRKNLLQDFGEQTWPSLFSTAEASHQLHIMKWIDERDAQYAYKRFYTKNMKSRIEAYEHVIEGVTASKVTEELCIKAAKYDKEHALVTLKWLRQNGYSWHERFCRAAALNDNLQALKWARNNNCPWNAGTLCEAAKRGNIPIIEYCLQNQCPMTIGVCACAMENKDHKTALAVLKLLRQNLCPWDYGTVDKAIYSGNFEAMLWAKRNGCAWRIDSFALLTQRGNVSIIEEVLQHEQQHGSNLFLQTEGTVKMTPDVIRVINSVMFVSRSSDSLIIEKLKLLRKYGYEWNAETFIENVKHGRLLVLQWLRLMGCSIYEDEDEDILCIAAVERGSIEILKYMHEVVGCRLSKEAYAYCFNFDGLDVAHVSYLPLHVRDSYTEILEYLEDNDCPRPDNSDWRIYSF